MTPAALDSRPSPPDTLARRIFLGARGLRAGWRLLLFYLVTFAATLPFLGYATTKLGVGENRPFTFGLLLFAEAVYLGATLAALAVMGRIENRRFADWRAPLAPLSAVFGGRFWEGAGWGIGFTATIAAVLASVGAYRVAGVASGSGVARAAGLWLLGALLIGVYEELSFRGYQLTTLADGVGWWPAAVLMSLYFGFVLHYLEKPDETLLDGVNVSLVALFLAESVRRTGTIWFAAGCHFAFNFVALFVLGSPNTAFGGAIEPH